MADKGFFIIIFDDDDDGDDDDEDDSGSGEEEKEDFLRFLPNDTAALTSHDEFVQDAKP
jgi:hypothetical protein